MSNKVRPTGPDRPPEPGPRGPQLVCHTAGTASIRDESRPLPRQQHLASLTATFEGWTLSVPDVGVYGPFSSAEEAAVWWSAHRGAWPAPPRHRLPTDDWPPRE